MEKNKSFLRNEGVQALLSSILCIIIGLIIGYIVLLFINPQGASGAILAIIKNWANSSRSTLQLKNLGSTLVNTAPLLLCSLSVLFAYKVGLFNIGASGQYTAGIIVALYGALALHLPWIVCMVLSIIAGAIVGAISGALKAYQNVSEVISGIMLNWILLYAANMILSSVKEPSDIYTLKMAKNAPQAILPTLGLNSIFNNHQYVGIAIPIALIAAILVWIILDKTKLGYELKATGLNKNGAKYAGMKENQNIILTMAIAGGLAGLAASCLYLTGITEWSCATASVPGMGFNGIAAAFLGGLNPLGSILSSYFIQHISMGGSFVDLSIYPSQVADLISSIIIYLCGFVAFFKLMMNQFLDKKDAKGGK
ncbi:MAG: ABC transporter permease [Firmicutes bacterium]|nr:ABC transporter permease [Bacillota bacterium]